MIQEGVRRVLKKFKTTQPYTPAFPLHMRLEAQTDIAFGYQRQGWNRIDGVTVEKVVHKPEQAQDFRIL